MKLYRIYNGYTGDSAVHVLVVAESKERALELAAERFKQESESRLNPYPSRYWQNLTAEFLCECSAEYASDVCD
ncbi:MAG: hypothetical protein ACYDCO_26530 [Armatimonadota bacterium]